MAKCEAFYVEFINDRVVPWGTQRTVVAPRERGVDDAASGHTGSAVAPIGCEILASADSIAEQSVAPFDRAHNLLCVRIQQQFIRVEAQAFFRIVGPVHPITVEKAGPGLREIAVPDVIRPPAHRYPLGLTPAFGVKKTKFDSTRSACSENSAKFTPSPSHVAPIGYGSPRQTAVFEPFIKNAGKALIHRNATGMRTMFQIGDGRGRVSDCNS